jgi:hypothetical protein
MSEQTTPPRIAGVALLTPRGEVVALPAPNRHHHVISHMVQRGYSEEDTVSADQGFVMECGTFISRRAALRVAYHSGQCRNPAHPAHGLFSEDVW